MQMWELELWILPSGDGKRSYGKSENLMGNFF